MAFLLQHLLMETASRLPDREAVRFQGVGLTYAQLDELTNQLARTLHAHGVRRGDRVGIYVSKSLASIINIFGILKVGGVYVPLDPNAPPSRLAYITNNCSIKVLLTSPEKGDFLSKIYESGTPIESVVLTEPGNLEDAALPDDVRVTTWEQVQTYEGQAVEFTQAIDTDLAYILYTSGSTGVPKGVMISHRTIFTFIDWCHSTLNLTENDRITSHAPIHFDLSTFDIFATIKAGGTVVLVPEKLSIFPIRLVKLLQDEQITVTYMVPSIYSLMVNYGKLSAHDLSKLRLVLFAGEVFPLKYLRRLMQTIPHANYFNLYGPTETNVCTYYQVQESDIAPERTQPVPIGVACDNIEVFAIDPDGQLVTTPGVEGELWVRGSCIAQGYWGDAEKTAKLFLNNPFEQNYDDLAYRTGDLVVLAKDEKNWIYVGRSDHMVKSRGYRIELGEIEAAIYQHHNVKEAAVIAIPDELVGNRIQAYIVPADRAEITEKEVQIHCSNLLPRYMVPEKIELRESLPKTSTGKINRKELAQV